MEFLLQLIAELFAGTPEDEQAIVKDLADLKVVASDKTQEAPAELLENTPNIFNVIQFR